MSLETVNVIIPVFNEEAKIARTLLDLDAAARRASHLSISAIIIDDGSSDRTPESVATVADQLSFTVRLIRQKNAGRFAARARGIAEATGDLVLFLDSRVSLHPGSLEFIQRRIEANAEDTVWNAHVVIDSDGNPYGRFWSALTELAYSEYFSNPRTTSFGAATFDVFPKGTTCFLAPRDLVMVAFGRHESYYADSRNANDDTPMIRRIAELHPIGISPEFACIYQPRDALGPFLRHAFHRGVVFLDGHGRSESRFFPAIALFYPLSAAAAVLVARRPWLASRCLALSEAGRAHSPASSDDLPRRQRHWRRSLLSMRSRTGLVCGGASCLRFERKLDVPIRDPRGLWNDRGAHKDDAGSGTAPGSWTPVCPGIYGPAGEPDSEVA